MANTVDLYFPEMWATESLAVLSSSLVMANLVHRDFEPTLARMGDTVNTRLPANRTARDKAAGGTFTIDDVTASNVAVVLNKHKYNSFLIDDVENVKSVKDLVEEFIEPAMIALAEAIDVDLLSLESDVVTNQVGSAGVAPTAPLITEARKKLVEGKVPLNQFGGPRGVVAPSADKELLDITQFTDADRIGDDGTAIREAQIGKKYGINFFTDQNVQTGAGSPTPTNNLVFHRNAFALVTRPLSTVGVGVQQAIMEFAGVGLRVTIGYNMSRGGNQANIEVLYGVKTLREGFAVKMIT